MRLSSTTLLALPLLASAAQQQNPLEQAMETAQYYLGKISSYVPHWNTWHEVDAAAARAGGKNIEVLSLNNWESTLRSSVKQSSKGPEEWWVLLTGGNKTCFGLCDQINKSYNETALLFTVDPTAPHLAYINCDFQPILCNSWAAGPPSLYIMEMFPAPAPVPVHIISLNTTTTSVKTFTDLKTSKSWNETPAYGGYFHPFDGPIAKFGLAQPLGWWIFFFSVVPSWMFMIGISFLSRTFMGRRATQPTAPAGAAPRGARPGDASM